MYLFPNKNLDENINRFLSYFSDKISLIHPDSGHNMDKLFVKLLSVGLLDALSKTTVPSNISNRDRLVSFVRNFTEWKNCDKVSLPHLVKFLELFPNPEFAPLREYAFMSIDKWTPGIVISIDNDVDINELKCLWPKNAQKPIDNITLEHLQHVHLFYSYRNGLMHELREKGYGMEIGMDTEPYYHTMSDGDAVTWELVYPVNFYKHLCNTAVVKLKDYYIKNRINPYNYFTFGTYWVEKLNINGT
jgi:hypothetical protein